MGTFKKDKNNVSSETLKYWAKESATIIKLKEKLDLSDPFMKARLEWAEMSEEEKIRYYSEKAPIVDRWQAETEAMEE